VKPEIKLKILQVVQDSGEFCGFTKIWREARHGKSTVDKYLKQMVEEGLLLRVTPEGQPQSKYQITPAGQDELAQNLVDGNAQSKVSPAESSPGGLGQPAYLQQLISFYKQIFVDDEMIGKIALLFSRLGEKVVQLAEGINREDFYWALWYIFVNGPGRELAMNMREFCEFHKVKRISLEYFLDKITSLDVGLHRVNRAQWDCFYHDQDELGTNLARMVDEFLTAFQFRKGRQERSKSAELVEQEKLPVAGGAQKIFEDLIDKKILNVTDAWRVQFTEHLRRYIVRRAMDRGFKAEDLPAEWPAEEVDHSLNYLAHFDDLVGFCGMCGNWMGRGMRICPRCLQEVTEKTPLVISFLEARDLARKYKEEQAEQYKNCPHCGYRIVPGFIGKCPSCNKDIELPPEEELE
jgi:predicted transcriptional regulator/DNA-directed RNA polymerase subunit RPC12/RpoP